MALTEMQEKQLVEMAYGLYQSIGHDLVAACGLGPEDAYPEADEVAWVLADKLGDHLQDEGHSELCALWRNLPTSKMLAICMRAL